MSDFRFRIFNHFDLK